MPVKNDTIHIPRTNKISPRPMTRHQQISLDLSLQHEINLKANKNEAMNSEHVDQIPQKSNTTNDPLPKSPTLAFSAESEQRNEEDNKNITMETSLGQSVIDSSPGHVNEKDVHNNFQIEDVLDDDKKEAYKIPMSYDSGLNSSIDNEYLLEEEYYADEHIEMPYGRLKGGIHGCDVVI
ncbi:uncharacterized protein LOC144419843 [Styela clava]